MAEPVYSDTTERMWARLPEYIRVADSGQNFTLKRWFSSVADELGTVVGLLDRIDYVSVPEGGGPGDTSDLVDPATADSAWLPWLAQAVGVTLDPTLSDAERRSAIAGASTGFMAGTKTAVARAAQTELSGTKHAEVYDHRTDSGPGTMWDVLIVTRPSETPGSAEVLAAVSRKGAKPAGVTLWWRAYEASWDTLATVAPTWNDIEALGSWDAVQEAGLS